MSKRHIFKPDGGRDLLGLQMVCGRHVQRVGRYSVQVVPTEHVQLRVFRLVYGVSRVLRFAFRGLCGVLCMQGRV